ncbi:major facilitator superfamily domain-containing protein 12-like isoform X2 [Mytilus californianus]|uniref:major facilitator superfamily domain-containing protein 12-like isoform X2 n=1 Tax=Mytilus californianus TaxID=6549 RepID=UPI0022456E7B|nr:major facilitator superfamily domain-containing protein 12-like isoform X2 [Mytilus californianus]
MLNFAHGIYVVYDFVFSFVGCKRKKSFVQVHLFLLNLVLILVAIGSVFCFIFHIIVKEKDTCNQDNVEENRVPEEHSNTTTEGIPILMTWKCWLKEIQFYQIGVVYMCARIFVNVTQIYLPLFITETLHMEKDNVAVIPLVVYISGFFMSLLMKPINTKIGKKAIYFVGIIFGVAGCTWIHFLESSTSTQAYGVAILVGIGGSTMLVTAFAMNADLIGGNTESSGFVYGSISFTEKLSSGVVVVVIQHMHPCKTCAGYYRTILTFVPASATVVASLCLLTLLSTKLCNRSLQASKDVNKHVDDIAVKMDENNAQVQITKF